MGIRIRIEWVILYIHLGTLLTIGLESIDADAQDRPRNPQTREHGVRVVVPAASVLVDDGDTFDIVWAAGDSETVRILGIDTPETMHPAHSIPKDQQGGPEA